MLQWWILDSPKGGIGPHATPGSASASGYSHFQLMTISCSYRNSGSETVQELLHWHIHPQTDSTGHNTAFAMLQLHAWQYDWRSNLLSCITATWRQLKFINAWVVHWHWSEDVGDKVFFSGASHYRVSIPDALYDLTKISDVVLEARPWPRKLYWQLHKLEKKDDSCNNKLIIIYM